MVRVASRYVITLLCHYVASPVRSCYAASRACVVGHTSSRRGYKICIRKLGIACQWHIVPSQARSGAIREATTLWKQDKADPRDAAHTTLDCGGS